MSQNKLILSEKFSDKKAKKICPDNILISLPIIIILTKR